MQLSILSLRVGRGGRADPGEFDIFKEGRVKFPTSRLAGDLFPGLLIFQDGGHIKFPTLGQQASVKIPTQGKAL